MSVDKLRVDNASHPRNKKRLEIDDCLLKLEGASEFVLYIDSHPIYDLFLEIIDPGYDLKFKSLYLPN